MTRNQEIAATILEQLGGRRFQVMTGTKNFIAIENGVSMKLTRNSAGAQYLKITLNSMDTYDMIFFKVNSKTLDRTTIKEYNNVYDDMLQDLFTDVTGLNTHL